jgi:hypothetical protein
MTGPLVRRSRSSETAWMTTLAASLPAGVTIASPSEQAPVGRPRTRWRRRRPA